VSCITMYAFFCSASVGHCHPAQGRGKILDDITLLQSMRTVANSMHRAAHASWAPRDSRQRCQSRLTDSPYTS
jgi:hypothetical protein